MTQKQPDEMDRGSGNVFADLGFPDPEVMQLKAYLVICIEQEMKARGLTQTDAAKMMGIRQPKLSALLKGQFDNCTIDRLVKYLTRLDQQVEVVVKRRAV